MSHYILKCSLCQAVLAQCRCPSKDKTVQWQEGCANCKPKEQNRAATPEDVDRLLLPHVKELVARHGVKKANQLLKQAAKAAGLDPTSFKIEEKYLS